MRKRLNISLIILTCCILLASCSDQKISTNPAYRLSFSTDTISFDTVFTTIGSTTANFMIYNHNSQPVSISSVTLENGATSGFKINVDGTIPTNNQLSNIEIKAHDSLYVFVEVTVNPTQQNNPLLIQDSIMFITNGNTQSVKLRAYGQDVTIFRNKTIHNDTTLTATKPYLIYGYLAIDNGKTLTINPGATLYFHSNAYLKVNGNLIADGKSGNPITFRGDRLDDLFPGVPYRYLSGQWGGIQLLGSRSTYSLNYAVITGGTIGIALPNGTTAQQPIATIGNSRIQNFDSCGIFARNALVTIYNSEISNCKSYCLYFLGGTYNLTHNTVANYYNDIYTNQHRDGTPSVMLLNTEQIGQNTLLYPINAQFVNCAIAGSLTSEFEFSNTNVSAPLQYSFDHCYIMSPPIQTQSQTITNVQWGTQTDDLFRCTSISNNSYYDFRPDSLSQLRKKANIIISEQPLYRYDMNGNDRLWDNLPDIGAYQWLPK